ncbi:MAG: DUF167 domain-containing protein [Actinobacteria bacterium]|nr:MAG: DUF167 domain-containing protein [Actinomycetota bacterium]
MTGSDVPVRLDIVVQPRSSRSEVAGTVGGALKVRVNAPPAEGKANEESVKVLADFFDVPKSSVRVIAGATSRRKVVEIAGIDAREAAHRLGGLG